MKPSEKINLFNGDLECLLCNYEVFEGKRKDFVVKGKERE